MVFIGRASTDEAGSHMLIGWNLNNVLTGLERKFIVFDLIVNCDYSQRLENGVLVDWSMVSEISIELSLLNMYIYM